MIKRYGSTYLDCEYISHTFSIPINIVLSRAKEMKKEKSS